METVLFIALSLALLEYYFGQVALRQSAEGPTSLRTERAVVRSVGIGLLGGALTLARPEGLALIGLVIVALLLLPRPAGWSVFKSRLLMAAVSLLALGVMLAPYFAFNLRASGAIFPNTFYAKQAEYQVDWPLHVRFWRVLLPTLVGGQVLLLPGFLYAAYDLVRRKEWSALVPLAWWLALLTAYTLRLPVDYQHGRYLMPSIPILIVYGVWGTSALLRPRSPHLAVRVVSRALPAAIALLVLLFLGRGAQAYREDVGFIEGEMVVTANWLNENTEEDDLLAVHDIGAVGYLTDRPLLDLAGLITPEVIPFMTDADQLADWMFQQGAIYTLFFPDFSPTYAQLATDLRFQQVHCTDYGWTRSQGLENMCVYRLTPRGQP
jgi:hypothetical protein